MRKILGKHFFFQKNLDEGFWGVEDILFWSVLDQSFWVYEEMLVLADYLSLMRMVGCVLCFESDSACHFHGGRRGMKGVCE